MAQPLFAWIVLLYGRKGCFLANGCGPIGR
jgi:hypothetical protein